MEASMEVYQLTEWGVWYFTTPSQESHYRRNHPVGWRGCGYQNAVFFWDCSIIKDYWRGIHAALRDILSANLGYLPKKKAQSQINI